MLRELYDGDLRPSVLAEKLGLTRGAVSKLARRLVSKLMITQQASAGDGRAQMLGITDTGRAVVQTLAVCLDDTDEEFFGDLGPGARALFVSILRETIRRRGSSAVPADWG